MPSKISKSLLIVAVITNSLNSTDIRFKSIPGSNPARSSSGFSMTRTSGNDSKLR